MKQPPIIDAAFAQRAEKLIPILEERYRTLTQCLQNAVLQASDPDAQVLIDDCDLWLAQRDLLSVLSVITGAAIHIDRDEYDAVDFD